MKNLALPLAIVGLYLIGAFTSIFGQALSTNTVKYKLTYDVYAQVYTVWVHPDYSTPNANNANTNEFSATAQVSLKVPLAFVIQDITDIKGVWEKDPRKLGDPVVEPALASETYDKASRYYAIGKAPIETNLGKFTVGDSIALFTFKGNGCLGPVSILTPTDPFIAASNNATSLNVRASFYSRSGQPAGGNEVPKEQFIAKKGPDAFCEPNAQIGVAKYITDVINNNNGSFDVATTIKVVNTGAVTLQNIQVFDTLSNTFPAPATYTMVGGVTSSPSVAVNGGFSGSGNNTGLLSGTGTLASGDSLLLSFTVRLVPGSNSPGLFQNVAWGQGTFNNTLVKDKSTDGKGPDPDFNGDPSDNEIPTPISVTQNADVALRVSISNGLPQVNDNVTLRLVLENQGSLEVKDLLPNGVQFLSSSGDGTYTEGKWTVGTVAAGDSAVILLTIKVISMGVQYYTAEVSAMTEIDIDSSPDNGVPTEDDIARVCVSTPILMCSTQAVELSVPAGSLNVQWFKNGTPLVGENGLMLRVVSAGAYTFTTSNNTCPAGGCCPIIVEEVDCCPVNICVPVVVTRIRRGTP